MNKQPFAQAMHKRNFSTVPAIAVIAFFLSVFSLSAQKYAQTLKGSILDKAVKSPLPGATVLLVGLEPSRGAVSDAEGRFRIPDVPVGRYTLRISYLGYGQAEIPNVLVISGKETEVTVELEEELLKGAEVVISAKAEKQKPLNELAAVSARTFSVDETRRFAAAVNDPGRMASAYAGVVTGNDGNNTIVIRGNSPNGLLWRLEGIDIPNPNHFSAVGTSGGGISILSAQLLSNSDFLTGAFPAEYGNALSGVFDLRLRQGNSEKYEYTLQAGVLGLDVAAEGPLRLGNQTGSFLANYRYSTLSLLNKIGVPVGGAPTDFQDLSFNTVLPAGRAGKFTVFGLGGLSSQKNTGLADSIAWKDNEDDRYTYSFGANTGVLGLTHTIGWDNTFLKTVISASQTLNKYFEDEYQDNYSLQRNEQNRFRQNRYLLSSVLSHKFNARHFLRAGAYLTRMQYDMQQSEWNDDREFLQEQLRSTGEAVTLNSFAQWQYRITKQLTLSAGLHSLYFNLNNRTSLEPRGSVRYALTDRQTITFGFGEHAQIQPLGTYYMKFEPSPGEPAQYVNRDLDFTRARHYVLSYDLQLPYNMHIKTEAYYQQLRHVPVSPDPTNYFSMLNNPDGFVFEELTSKGKGRNYGVELTFEKFLTNGLYFLLSNSFYDAEYQAADGAWRNSRFNTRFTNSLVAGKEWDWVRGKKNRTFGLNMKWTYTGGLLQTPVLLEASRQKGETVLDESRPFSEQMPNYLRLDLGARLKRNYPNLTTMFSIDIQNTTNRKNVFGRYFNDDTGNIEYFYQAPLIPVLSYRVDF